jgi:hypothetical protein
MKKARATFHPERKRESGWITGKHMEAQHPLSVWNFSGIT